MAVVCYIHGEAHIQHLECGCSGCTKCSKTIIACPNPYHQKLLYKNSLIDLLKDKKENYPGAISLLAGAIIENYLETTNLNDKLTIYEIIQKNGPISSKCSVHCKPHPTGCHICNQSDQFEPHCNTCNKSHCDGEYCSFGHPWQSPKYFIYNPEDLLKEQKHKLLLDVTGIAMMDEEYNRFLLDDESELLPDVFSNYFDIGKKYRLTIEEVD